MTVRNWKQNQHLIILDHYIPRNVNSIRVEMILDEYSETILDAPMCTLRLRSISYHKIYIPSPASLRPKTFMFH